MPRPQASVAKKKALDTLVLSAAGRGVVQVAAHERCVPVQCTIHKNLHFKNSIARLFRQAGLMAPEVIFERSDGLARRRQWKKKALDTLVLSAAGRGVVQVAAHERCVLVQCTVHKNLCTSRIQSLACFDRLVKAHGA